MFEKWRDPMFIDAAHHHYRLRLEIDAFAIIIIVCDLKSMRSQERLPAAISVDS